MCSLFTKDVHRARERCDRFCRLVRGPRLYWLLPFAPLAVVFAFRLERGREGGGKRCGEGGWNLEKGEKTKGREGRGVRLAPEMCGRQLGWCFSVLFVVPPHSSFRRAF